MLPEDTPGLNELRNFLRTENERAHDGTLDDARAVALRAYQGEPYGDETEGRSQAVTRDVAEVVDIMLVGMLGTVLSGGKAVEFETEADEVPMPTDDNPQAMQTVDYGAEATAAVHYQFMRKQPGYRIIHDAAKAGMLEKTGIVKTYAFPQRPLEMTAEVPGGAIEGEGDDLTVEGRPVIAAEPVDPLEAALNPVEALHRVTVQVEQPRVIRDRNIPNEWFRTAPDTVDLDESVYNADKMPVSASDLIAMGFDPVVVEKLWSAADDSSVVQQARDAERGQTSNSIGQRTGAAKRLWLWHEFPLWDWDGDGIAERLDVMRVGQTILRVEVAEDQPYSGWTPVPSAHRFTGQSMYDKTGDIQRIRTVLLRQGLDSIYLSTAPRTLLNDASINEDTIDDLLTVRAGGIIRYTGAVAPTPFGGTNDTSAISFDAMERVRGERDARTGVTAQSQGMNPDSLNKTASGMAMLQQNADQIELYVTRNLVEQLMMPMFTKRYRLMRVHLQPFRMKIDGKYRQIDPSQWPEEPDVTINVGLGTGSKDQRLAYRRELIAMQQAAVAGGLRIVGERELFNSGKAFVDDTSLGVATDYFIDPATLGAEKEKPDPAMLEAQGKAQNDAARIAGEQQLKMYAADTDRQVRLAGVDADAAVKREGMLAEQDLKQQRADAEAALAVRRQNFDMQLAERRAAFEEELARRSAKAEADDGGLPAYRPGGELDQ